jgi:hypothetical protein
MSIRTRRSSLMKRLEVKNFVTLSFKGFIGQIQHCHFFINKAESY